MISYRLFMLSIVVFSGMGIAMIIFGISMIISIPDFEFLNVLPGMAVIIIGLFLILIPEFFGPGS